MGILAPLMPINLFKGRMRITESFINNKEEISEYIINNFTNIYNCEKADYDYPERRAAPLLMFFLYFVFIIVFCYLYYRSLNYLPYHYDTIITYPSEKNNRKIVIEVKSL